MTGAKRILLFIFLLLFIFHSVIAVDLRPQGNISLIGGITIINWSFIGQCGGASFPKGILINGSWNCSTPAGSGTITGVTAGTGLLGGGTNGAVTLNVSSTVCTGTDVSQYNGTGFICITQTGGGGGNASWNQTYADGRYYTITNGSLDNTSWNQSGADKRYVQNFSNAIFTQTNISTANISQLNVGTTNLTCNQIANCVSGGGGGNITSLPAANITNGTFAGGDYVFPKNVTVLGNQYLPYQSALQFNTTSNNNFIMTTSDDSFNGVTDNIFIRGYNVKPGTTGLRQNTTESVIYESLEARYNDGTTNLSEWNINWGSADGTLSRRPIGASINQNGGNASLIMSGDAVEFHPSNTSRPTTMLISAVDGIVNLLSMREGSNQSTNDIFAIINNSGSTTYGFSNTRAVMTTSGGYLQFNKDATPTAAGAIGLSQPGGAIGQNLILAGYTTGTGWITAVLINSTTGETWLQGGGTRTQLRLGVAGANYYDIGRGTSDGLLYFNGSQSGFNGYVFGGANGERLRIDSSGNLLVGTTTATQLLTVAGGANITGTLYAGATNLTTDQISQGSTNKYYVTQSCSGGNSTHVNVSNGTTSTGVSCIMVAQNPGSNNGGWLNNSGGGNISMANTAANISANVLFIDNTNTRVGIGTVFPRTKVEIAGTNNAITYLRINTSSNTTSLTSDSPVLELLNSNVSNTQTQSNNNYARIDFSAINFTGSIFNMAGIAGVFLNHTNSTTNYNGALAFLTMNAGTSAERLRIDNTGKVGIGSTNPVNTLDVVGSTNVSAGVLYVNGTGLVRGNTTCISLYSPNGNSRIDVCN